MVETNAYEYEAKDLTCPKCASAARYRLKYEVTEENGAKNRVLFGRVHCIACKAMIVNGSEKNNAIASKTLAAYDYARKLVDAHGYGDQIKWLRELLERKAYKTISVVEFFSEYTWVVFASGFKADLVRKYWPGIRDATRGFNPILVREMTCEELLEKLPIKNKQKAKAIASTSRLVSEEWLIGVREARSWEEIKGKLRKLPFVGDITVWHLMRNLGVDCFKPDRHIENLATELGERDADIFGEILRAGRETLVGVADFVLWRACATLGSARELVYSALNGREIPKLVREKENTKITDFLF